MKILYGDVFEAMKEFDAVGIPTNGTTNSSGLAIMGAGVAKSAVQTFGPWLREFLGAKIDREGNRVHVIDAQNERGLPVAPQHIFSFPTKHQWFDKRSDITLIEKSAEELREVIHARGWRRVCMPEPGTGMGGLRWEQVMPVLGAHFGDELTIVRLKAVLDASGGRR